MISRFMEIWIDMFAALDVHSDTILVCVIKGNHKEDCFKGAKPFPTLTKD